MLFPESEQRIWAGDQSLVGDGCGWAGARPAGSMDSGVGTEEIVI